MKTNKQKIQKKCDLLLTPIIKKLHPFCEACGSPTQVAHHFIEKSRSNRLRYDLKNLVGLCNICHCKIHNRFGNSISNCLDISDILRHNKGSVWYEELKIVGREIVKADLSWYQENYERLSKI